MADQFSFTDGGGNVVIEEGKKGLNPGMVVLHCCGGEFCSSILSGTTPSTHTRKRPYPSFEKEEARVEEEAEEGEAQAGRFRTRRVRWPLLASLTTFSFHSFETDCRSSEVRKRQKLKKAFK